MNSVANMNFRHTTLQEPNTLVQIAQQLAHLHTMELPPDVAKFHAKPGNPNATLTLFIPGCPSNPNPEPNPNSNIYISTSTLTFTQPTTLT